MKDQIKILHIDPYYQVIYFIISENSTIKSTISLEETIALLKNEKFDLILSDPHRKAMLVPQNSKKLNGSPGGFFLI